MSTNVLSARYSGAILNAVLETPAGKFLCSPLCSAMEAQAMKIIYPTLAEAKALGLPTEPVAFVGRMPWIKSPPPVAPPGPPAATPTPTEAEEKQAPECPASE